VSLSKHDRVAKTSDKQTNEQTNPEFEPGIGRSIRLFFVKEGKRWEVKEEVEVENERSSTGKEEEKERTKEKRRRRRRPEKARFPPYNTTISTARFSLKLFLLRL